MDFLSIMSKGTTQEKVLWSFDFLDIDRNGYIEKQEMTKESSSSIIQTFTIECKVHFFLIFLSFVINLYWYKSIN